MRAEGYMGHVVYTSMTLELSAEGLAERMTVIVTAYEAAGHTASEK